MNLRKKQLETLKKVLKQIHRAGFSAFVVGGAVRDALRYAPVHDFDIATSASPEDIETLFPQVNSIGKAFGTIGVREEGFYFEVTTFRSDFDYKDGRHPQRIQFSSLKEDAQRRDFTINALYYDLENKKIIDYHGGVADLFSKKLQTIGCPEERFQEDALRILRAVRFEFQLQFQMEKETEVAVKKMVSNLLRVSKERCFHELEKMFQFSEPYLIYTRLKHLGLLNVLWVEWQIFGQPNTENIQEEDRKKILDEFEEQLKKVNTRSYRDFLILLSFHEEKLHANNSNFKQPKTHPDIGRDCLTNRSFLQSLLQGIKIPKTWIRQIEAYRSFLKTDNRDLIDNLIFIDKNSPQLFLDLLPNNEDIVLNYLERINRKTDQLPQPFINGEDLKNMGVIPSVHFKMKLVEIYKKQLQNPQWSKRELIKNYLQI